MRTFAGVEMLFFYLLIPGIIRGLWGIVKHPRPETVFLLMVIVCIAVPLSLVVANFGTLYRLRLLFLLPLLMVAAYGEPVQWYRQVFRRRSTSPVVPRVEDSETAFERLLSGRNA